MLVSPVPASHPGGHIKSEDRWTRGLWQGAVLVRSSCSQRTLMPFAASTKKVAMAADAAMMRAAMISLELAPELALLLEVWVHQNCEWCLRPATPRAPTPELQRACRSVL